MGNRHALVGLRFMGYDCGRIKYEIKGSMNGLVGRVLETTKWAQWLQGVRWWRWRQQRQRKGGLGLSGCGFGMAKAGRGARVLLASRSMCIAASGLQESHGNNRDGQALVDGACWSGKMSSSSKERIGETSGRLSIAVDNKEPSEEENTGRSPSTGQVSNPRERKNGRNMGKPKDNFIPLYHLFALQSKMGIYTRFKVK